MELLLKAGAVLKRIGRGPEFVTRVQQLSLKYKIKRNFIKLLENNRKDLYS